MNEYDALVVGCGLTGSVIARELAEKGKKILIIERRDHICGNMYDYVDENGVLVQKYGPHAFHTKKRELYEYVCRYAGWKDYRLVCGAVINGKYTPTPFNFQTVDDFFDAGKAESIKAALKDAYPDREFVPVIELLEHGNPLIREYAEFLFKNDYAPYTAKQWGISPDEIDPGVLRRVPVRLSYDTGYFDDEFQTMPEESFTVFFKKLLYHKNIEVRLNSDARDFLALKEETKEIFVGGEKFNGTVFYTGAIDELLGCRYGKLPYRSLRFEWKTEDGESFQNAPIVAYPQEKGFTRITEYTKLPVQDAGNKTVYAVEYPLPYKAGEENEPYYPVPTDESQAVYEKYRVEVGRYKKSILYWTINISLIVIPFIQIGPNRDFCMRASVPSLFMLNIFLLKEIVESSRFGLTFKNVIFIITLAFVSASGISSFAEAFRMIALNKKYPIVADSLITLSNKKIIGDVLIYPNYILEKPYEKAFFRYFTRRKSIKDTEKDMQSYDTLVCEHGWTISDGSYYVSPVNAKKYTLASTLDKFYQGSERGNKLTLSSAKTFISIFSSGAHWYDLLERYSILEHFEDRYHFVFSDDILMAVPHGTCEETGENEKVWGKVFKYEDCRDENCRWHIRRVGEYYQIIWKQYALTYDALSKDVFLSPADNSTNQLWEFERADPTERNLKYDAWKALHAENNYKIRNEFIISDWLKQLYRNSPRYTTFIAVRDEASVSITDDVITLMQNLGLKMSLRNKVQQGYIAVINGGNVVTEVMSQTRYEKIISEGKLDNGLKYHIESAGLPAGIFCSIIINGKQQAVNWRGLNFVVYDNVTKKIVDSVCFDTWAKGMPCYRK